MQKWNNILSFLLLLSLVLTGLMLHGCAGRRKVVAEPEMTPPPLTLIEEIDSFNSEEACRQAVEVINNNPYEQVFFEKVFAQIVRQCHNSKSPANAELIWENFVEPLSLSGKIPPDLAKTIWNYYFSRQFVSLPSQAPVIQYCSRLPEIKKNLEKEYQLKGSGFEMCGQGSPDAHFLNAMYVYNTMWAVCHETD